MFRIITALAAAGVLGAGSLTASGAAVATTAASGALPHCGNADLVAHYRYDNSGAGHRFAWIVLTNRSGHTCTTGGFDGLSYVGEGNGTQIGAAATRDGRGYRTYVLRPGQRLRSSFSATDAQLYPRAKCRPTHVDGFRVYVPNSYRAQFVRFATLGCANPQVQLLSIKSNQRP